MKLHQIGIDNFLFILLLLLTTFLKSYKERDCIFVIHERKLNYILQGSD